jgi:integrase
MANIIESDGVYRIRVSMRVKGQIKQDSMTWKPADGMTKSEALREANKAAVQFEDEFRKRSAAADQNMTFKEFSRRWMTEYASSNVRDDTYRRYESLLVRINNGMGSIRLSKLQPMHITEFMKNLAEADVRSDTKYKARINLRDIIKERGLQFREIARLTGLSESTVHKAIDGKCVSMNTATIIADALDYEFGVAFVLSETAPETLSEKSLLHHYRLISIILNTAVYWFVIPSNPIKQVRPPRVRRKQAKYLDDDQAIRLLKYLENADTIHRLAITALLYTGCRRSELLALTWKDVDFESSRITIEKSLHYMPGRGLYLEDTKTEESNRTVKLAPVLADAMRTWRTEQKRMRLAAGKSWKDAEYVFSGESGKPIVPDNLTQWFSCFIKKTDLPQISIHSLRHTAATLMIMGGAPIRAVSDMLGHAKTSTTTDIYSHAIKKFSDGAADVLSEMLRPSSKAATY